MNPWAIVVAVAVSSTTPTVPVDQVRGDVGDVMIVDATGIVMNAGTGADRFFVVLPDGAACPGDSANDQWRAQTFLLPESEDVLEAWFGSSGPEPPWVGTRFPLFEASSGLPLSQLMLQRNDVAGAPGIIEQIGETSLAVQTENGLVAGRYRIGVACSFFRQTTQYWDLVVEITVDGSPDQARVAWRVVDSPGARAPEETTEPLVTVGRLFIVLGVLLLIGVSVSGRRHRRHRDSSPVEPEPLGTNTPRPDAFQES